ncbi:MAG TPA: BBP7 family outer membrane beta-barrel protein [Gemmataceae bacterium]|nr:BBP7 family outer membrane beta-barrel protein [Gemmataceae bacterium]
MRTYLATLILAAAAIAQAPETLPPVSIGDPVPATPVPTVTLPSPSAIPPVPASPDGFGTELPPGTVVSPPMGTPPVVRPPTPVFGAQPEVPPGPIYWTGFDYLCWRAKGGPVVPLVSAVVGAPALANPLDANMAFALSSDEINRGPFSGFRLTAGMWLDKPRGSGVEAVFMWFPQQTDTTTYTDAPGAALARPFLNARTGTPDLFQLSTPTGTVRGAAAVRSTLETEELELNHLHRGNAMFSEEMYWVMGVRYWGLDESLTTEVTSRAGGVTATSFDTFTTRNRFYGLQLGPRLNFYRYNISVTVGTKWAVGIMSEESDIRGGSSMLVPPGVRFDRQGGVLAQATNIGEYDRTKLAWLRDFSLSVGYCLSPGIVLRVGYDLLWVSNVLRPGGQIDPAVNPTLFPFGGAAPAGAFRPVQRFDGEVFWMHGVSLGLEVRF